MRFRNVRLTEVVEPVSAWPGGDAQQWMAEIAALPVERQAAAVEMKLRDVNPRFRGKLNHRVQAGAVTDVQFVTDNVTNIEPVRALSGLQRLYCNATLGRRSKLHDLAPLAGLKLSGLVCFGTEISDLTPLRGMPLISLDIGNTQVADLSPLRGMPLRELRMGWTSVTDLSPIARLPLTVLWCWSTAVSDLTPLRGMPLRSLYIHDTPVSDLSPLFDMKLEEILLTPSRIGRGMDELRQMKSVLRIDVQRIHNRALPPADQFWQKYDAGEFGKAR